MSFLEAIAATKVVNIFSSAVATLVFASRGVVDYRLGVLLGGVMFAGGLAGGYVAVRLSDLWLRRVVLAVVVALALGMIAKDLLSLVRG